MLFIPPPMPPIEVQVVETVECGQGSVYAGCWDGTTIQIDAAAIGTPMEDWVIAHEAAHSYGANECSADAFAYDATGNETMFRAGSPYAERCGNAGAFTPGTSRESALAVIYHYLSE